MTDQMVTKNGHVSAGNLADRIEAAIRLLYPDEITPTAKHVIMNILEEERGRA